MARPQEFDDLATTSVTVARSQLREARAKGINVSEVLRDALAVAIRSRKPSGFGRDARAKISGVPVFLKNKAVKMISSDPRVAPRWAEIINARCGTDLNVHDLMELIPRC